MPSRTFALKSVYLTQDWSGGFQLPCHIEKSVNPLLDLGILGTKFRRWAGIFFGDAVMAAGTLLMLDASLPGGLIEVSGSLRYAQTWLSSRW